MNFEPPAECMHASQANYYKLLQSDWSFTHQHFRCLVLSPFESCQMIDIMLPRKPNICHVRDIMFLCKRNIYHASHRKVILRRVVCSDTYNPYKQCESERNNKLG